MKRARSLSPFSVNVWPPFVDALVLVLSAFALLMIVSAFAQKRLIGELRGQQAELQRLRAEKERIERRLRALAPQGVLEIEEGKVILQGEVLFASGSEELQPEGQQFIASLGKPLSALLDSEQDQMILVGGHTDDVPTRGGRFASNWDLSSARAVAVARALQAHGVPAKRVAAAGFGEHHPRASNQSPDGRQRNRRIEILIVPMASVSSR